MPESVTCPSMIEGNWNMESDLFGNGDLIPVCLFRSVASKSVFLFNLCGSFPGLELVEELAASVGLNVLQNVMLGIT